MIQFCVRRSLNISSLATKEEFTREIETAGFGLQENVVIPGFKETFMRRFIRN